VRALVASLPAAALASSAAAFAGTQAGLDGSAAALLELAVGGTVYAAGALPLLYVVGDAPTREALERVPRRLSMRARAVAPR